MVDDKPLCRSTENGINIFNRLHSEFAESALEEDVKEAISNTELGYVGQGDARVVLFDETGEYLNTRNACVVKIHKHGDNTQNMIEVRNWEEVSGDPKDHLLRITDWDDDYRWVIQPYISNEVTDEMLMELEKTFAKNGLKIRDVSKRNARRVEDRAVMIDYGRVIEDINFSVMDLDERLRLIEWKYD